MSRANRLFKAPPPSQGAPGKNRENYPAWDLGIEEKFLQTLLTNTLGDTYYVKQGDLLEESAAIHTAMLEKDPAFYARGLVFSRQAGYMRLQPIYGLANLAGKAPLLFEKVFDQVILTPKDLTDFAAVISALRGGSQGGRAVKRIAGRWLLSHLTEYWLIKYGAEKDAGYSLADLFHTYHPKGEKNWMVDYLLGHQNAAVPEGSQVYWFEMLKRAKTDEEKVRAITEGRLPHEVATAFAGSSQAVWNAIAPQLPIFALVRHLDTLNRHGVLDHHRERIEALLSNPDAVRKSKMFPYQFLRALEHVSAGWAQDALRGAVDLAFENIPEVTGRTAVLLDTSGSMVDANMQQMFETAKLYALALIQKTHLNGKLFAFDISVREIPVSMRDSLLSQAAAIEAYTSWARSDDDRRGVVLQAAGLGEIHGTWTSGPMEYMIQKRIAVDNLIVVTDGQQNQGRPFIDSLAFYRGSVSPKVKTFVIDVSPYTNAVEPIHAPDSYAIYGWSDQILSFIGLASAGWKSMAEHVKAATL